MILGMYIVVMLILMLLLIYRYNPLHPAEAFFYFMVTSIIGLECTLDLSLNIELIKISPEVPKALSFIINVIFLEPILIVGFLKMVVSVQSMWKKLGYFLFFYVVLCGSVMLMEHLEIIKFAQWQPWMSCIYWVVLLLISLALCKGYRHLLKKAGIQL
ncbi:hypothetical protein [Brevibacillus dissolubilis]|uniref:hypothetical protein n=1 Tax=Brevibacillus dissolubilis TaxID=1844116 RepID=UPI0011170997|nr:hypothetical protein [Brevibacillus dissolubilis]